MPVVEEMLDESCIVDEAMLLDQSVRFMVEDDDKNQSISEDDRISIKDKSQLQEELGLEIVKEESIEESKEPEVVIQSDMMDQIDEIEETKACAIEVEPVPKDAKIVMIDTKDKLEAMSSGSTSSNKSGGPPGSDPFNEKLQTNRQEKTCYGRELWDCIPILELNTKVRTGQMENVKELFSSIKKGLDNFSAHITYCTQIYNRKTQALYPE